MGFAKPPKRPVRWRPPPEMMINAPREQLAQAANRARYLRSPYHSRSAPGGPGPSSLIVGRRRFASKCAVTWVPDVAQEALRRAILLGNVSTEWRGIFPRYAWHRDGDTVYQAALSNQELGDYHAYPLESPLEWPKHMK